MPAVRTKRKVTSKKPARGKLSDAQKQMIGIGGATVAAYFLWRYEQHKSSGTPAAAAGQSAASFGQLAPYTPQQPITLQPGESIYDPNSGALLGAPGGTGGSSAGSGDSGGVSGPVDTTPVATQSTNPGQPMYTINVRYPKKTGTVKASAKPAKRKVTLSKPKVSKPKSAHHTPAKPVRPAKTVKPTKATKRKILSG